MMENIRNIIFDLGGILLNIDIDKTKKAFTSLGVTGFDDYFTQSHASQLFQLLETGKISPQDFHAGLVKETGVQLTYSQVVKAWNELLLDFPPERINWLRQIGKRYRIFLFSNTNQIHYDAFIESFYQQTGEAFNSFFIKAYYSHEMGMRKPDVASFEFIIREQALVPHETLFIDDTLKNVEAARMAGLQAIHLKPPQTVLDLPL